MMDRQEVDKQVRANLAAQLRISADFPDTDLLADHGLDSLASVQFTIDLEDTFGIVFEDEDIAFEGFATIRSVVDLLLEKLLPSR